MWLHEGKIVTVFYKKNQLGNHPAASMVAFVFVRSYITGGGCCRKAPPLLMKKSDNWIPNYSAYWFEAIANIAIPALQAKSGN